MTHPLRFGVRVSNQSLDVDTQIHLWHLVDEGDLDHLWTMDHIVAHGADPAQPIFDSWTLMAAMAVETRRARLGVLVTANLYRHPSLLAKMAVTVDHLSHGRVIVGLGASSAEREFTSLGLANFGAPADRVRRLNETCVMLKKLWVAERANHAGLHYRLVDAIAEPKPIQRPHPEIWIGGYGAKGTLRVAARHADVWNASGGRGFEATIAASSQLDEHCAAVGRDPTTIRRSVQLRWGGDHVADLREADRYVRAGFSEFVIDLIGDDPVRVAEDLIRHGLPALRALGATSA